MSQLIINTGTAPNTKDGDTVRNAFTKVNENFTEVYSTLAILTGGGGSGGDTAVNIKGNVSALNDTVLVDATAGKITTAAIPSNVPLIYQFRANFDGTGNLDTVTELPSGWTYTKNDNIATLTHTVSRYPKSVSYLGHSTVGVLRMRFPTAGYEVRIPDDDRTTIFTVNLTAAVTGADLSQYAYVVVTF
jgi:hypothetical protein